MRIDRLIVFGVAALFLVGSVPGVAQNQPSAKATARVGQVAVLEAAKAMGPVVEWQPIMSNALKVSQKKSLFMDVSLECGLETRTLVKSKGGDKDTSVARGTVRVRVLVDEVREAGRHEVTWDGRDMGGRTLASGIYFVQLEGERRSLTGRIVRVK